VSNIVEQFEKGAKHIRENLNSKNNWVIVPASFYEEYREEIMNLSEKELLEFLRKRGYT